MAQKGFPIVPLLPGLGTWDKSGHCEADGLGVAAVAAHQALCCTACLDSQRGCGEGQILCLASQRPRFHPWLH